MNLPPAARIHATYDYTYLTTSNLKLQYCYCVAYRIELPLLVLGESAPLNVVPQLFGLVQLQHWRHARVNLLEAHYLS